MASVEACYKAMSASPLQPQNTADDATLLDRYLKTGDKTQLGILFRQHADSAYRIALRVCGNSADAEDAVQAAFLQVLQRAPQYRGNSTGRGWIMSIGINCCRMEHRKDSQRRRREEEHASQAALSVDGGDEVSQNSELASAAISVVPEPVNGSKTRVSPRPQAFSMTLFAHAPENPALNRNHRWTGKRILSTNVDEAGSPTAGSAKSSGKRVGWMVLKRT